MSRLGDLVEIDPTPLPQGSRRPTAMVTLADIDAGFGTMSPRTVGPGEEIGRREARSGDVLFARISPAMENGKVAVVPESESRVFVSRELLVLRPNPGVDGRWIWSFLRQDHVRESLTRHLTGSSGRQRLKAGVVAELEIPEVPAQVRQSALEAVEEIDAARQLREKITGLLLKLPGAAATKVAVGAERRPLVELLDVLRAGTGEKTGEEGTVAVLRASNLKDGDIDTASLRYLPESSQRAHDELLPGDLLMVRSGSADQLGRAAVYEGDPPRATYATYLLRLRCRTIDPNFLWGWLHSEEATSLLLQEASEKSNRVTIGMTSLQMLAVPVPEPVQQREFALAARLFRELAASSRRQFDLLGAALQAHLTAIFDRYRSASPVPARPAAAPRPRRSPRDKGSGEVPVLLGASEDQLRVWEAVRGLERSFSLADLRPPENERASFQHSLALLEQLGVVVREVEQEGQRWHKPDPELDLLQ